MEKTAKRTAKIMAKATEFVSGVYRWPPDCFGIIHQPKRPDAIKKQHKKTEQ